MSYEIRKGWPSNGALDEVLMAADGATLTDGTVAVLPRKISGIPIPV